MPYIIGIVSALAISVHATALQLDRDRAFYPTVLNVIAMLYILFAAIGGASGRVFAIEAQIPDGANFGRAPESRRREITRGAKSQTARKSLRAPGARFQTAQTSGRARLAPLGISRLAPSVICATFVISRRLEFGRCISLLE